MANEKRLICVHDVHENARHHWDFQRCIADLISLEEVIEDCPTVDAVEVVHGRWRLETDEEEPNGFFKSLVCTACNKTAAGGNYCPNCGAKMDAKE